MAVGGSSFDLLKRIAKDELVHLLESVPGRKDLVIDESLMKPLDRIAGASLLRSHEVDKIFKLESGKQYPGGSEQRIYLIRPTLANCKFIADTINAERVPGATRHYTVIFMPRKLHACEMVLEQYGVYGYVAIHEYNLDLIPLDRDVLSLEMPEFFSSTFLDDTTIWMHTVARSLWHMQSLLGPIQQIYGIGRAAEMVHKLTETFFWEYGEAKPISADSMITHAFFFDRDLDYVTVFLSCLTYEALLDDIFGIQCGFLDLPSEVTKTANGAKLLVNNDDEVFDSIRNRHFSTVFAFLSQKAKQLQADFDKRNHLESVGELKQFVANELRGLKQQHRSLALMIGACEHILQVKSHQNFEQHLQTEHSTMHTGPGASFYRENINFLEELLCQQVPEHVALSLLCLLSLTQSGLPSKDYVTLRQQFCQAYGHKHMFTFHNLKRLGIVYEKDRSNPMGNLNFLKQPAFHALCKKFNLLPRSDDVNLKNPSDMSYIYNGAYVPLIPQLVSYIMQFGFSREDLSKSFFCPMFSKQGTGLPATTTSRKTVLVYFLGGVTYAEIACLRLLSRLKGYEIVIAATHVISRQKLVQSLSA